MLQHLVQMDHVEGLVGVGEREEVAHLEEVRGGPPRPPASSAAWATTSAATSTPTTARRHQPGEVGRDARGRSPRRAAPDRDAGGAGGRRTSSQPCARCGCATPFVVSVRVGHATIVACPIARDAGAGRAPRCRPVRPGPASSGSARSSVPQDLRPSPGDLKGATLTAVTRRAKYLVWHFDDENRIVLHLSQAGRLDIEYRRRRRSRGEPWPASSSVRERAASTGRASGSWCASTAHSARPRGGCSGPTTRAPSPTLVPNPEAMEFADFIRTSNSKRHLTTDLR